MTDTTGRKGGTIHGKRSRVELCAALDRAEARAEAAEAERDALAAKLALAVEAMAGFASWDHCWPGNVNLEAECRKIRATLAQLTADTPKDGKDDDQ